MPVSLENQAVATRPCVFCGKSILAHLSRCPHCREEIPQVHSIAKAPRVGGRAQIRRGLLYMLLAGVIQYFASGASGWTVPVAVPAAVTTYLAPAVFVSGLGLLVYAVFVSGLGLLVYGFYLRSRS